MADSVTRLNSLQPHQSYSATMRSSQTQNRSQTFSARRVALFGVASVLSLAGFAGAQESGDQPSDVRTVSARVQAFYDQTETLSARFQQRYASRVYRRSQRAAGRLVFDKPGRMRFDYDNGKVVVSNGRTLTAYEPGDEGERGQYAQSRVSDDELSSGFAFLTGRARIRQDYRTRLLNAAQYRWRGHILELRPRVADPRVARIILYVDARRGAEGVVHRLRFIDHEGNHNTFTMMGMRFNENVAEDHFVYTPPSGSHRIR